MQENGLETEEENYDVDTPARSSRALKSADIEDEKETSSEFDVIFEENVLGNLYEDTCAASGKEIAKTASTLGIDTKHRSKCNLNVYFNT